MPSLSHISSKLDPVAIPSASITRQTGLVSADTSRPISGSLHGCHRLAVQSGLAPFLSSCGLVRASNTTRGGDCRPANRWKSQGDAAPQSPPTRNRRTRRAERCAQTPGGRRTTEKPNGICVLAGRFFHVGLRSRGQFGEMFVMPVQLGRTRTASSRAARLSVLRCCARTPRARRARRLAGSCRLL